MEPRLVWDEPKRLANLDKHGLDFSELSISFFVAAMHRPARAGRRQAIGYLNGRPVSVIFSYLGSEALAIISLRIADPQERRLLDGSR